MNPNTAEKSPARRPVLFFFAGLIAGIILTLATGVFWNLHRAMRHYLAMQIGKILETQTLELKNGDRLTGLILSEDEQSIVFDFGKGSGKFTRSEITKIEKNAYARYIQGLW